MHPAPFRHRYEKEMLAIYDDVAACRGVLGLFADGVVSLFRQWVLRPDFRRMPTAEVVPVSSGEIPLLASLDSYTLRPAALLIGCVLSVALFSAVVIASERPGKLSSWLIGVHKATGSVQPISRSSLAEAEPNTLVRLGEEPENPWRAIASGYFKLIPVLEVLDANGDFVLSPWEMNRAPAALRRLDLNHDGKLNAEECGFSLGTRPQDAPDPEFVGTARKKFMRSQPVLAALDADHNGEISAEEIRNSAQYLRTLDRDGDHFLTPYEVMPDGAATGRK
jgi:hypothetical protein